MSSDNNLVNTNIYVYKCTPIFSVMLIDVHTMIIHSTPDVFIAKFP